jgi:PAS domain S-box-containing protein
LIQLAVLPSSEHVFFVVSDVFSLLVLAGLWRWSQSGHTQSAGYVLLILLVVGSSALLPAAILDRTLVIYAIPIMAASFLIGPGSSFVFAMLSALGYSLAWLAGGSASTYNYVSVLSLLIMALLAWLIAARLEQDRLERQRAEQAVHESERQMRALVTSLDDIVFEFDEEGTYLNVWTADESLLAQPKDQMLGRRIVQVLGEEKGRPFDEAVKRVLATGRAESVEYPLDVIGGQRWFVARTSPIVTPDNAYRTVSMLVRDITERKRAEEQLKEAMADLERSNAELQQFAYVASHDLQEPLRMVSSYLQLIAQRYRGRLDEDADEFIAFAVDGANRMRRLIDDLLAYSRVGTQGRPLAPTDSQAALNQALANLEIAIEEAGATVTSDPLPTVLADPGQLVQVFQNLIGNAVKFHGQAPSHIHISAQHLEDTASPGERAIPTPASDIRHPTTDLRPPASWVFSVRDNGIGIDPQQFERIFRVFQRLHTRAEYPGTGIGLAICKKIVERHGGRIWVESAPGQGATFYFTIPMPGGKPS